MDPDPYRQLRRQARDRTSQLTRDGVAATKIPDAVEAAMRADIDQVATTTIPLRGRSFWLSLSGALAWGVVTVVLFFMFGPAGGGGAPWLRIVVSVVVLVWALGFGIFAANHKVRAVRARVAGTARSVVQRTATQALAISRDDDRWWMQLRVRPGEVTGYIVDGSLAAVRQARTEPGPVALFVRAPGFFQDEARFAAERFGMSLFVLGGPQLISMSSLASAALTSPEPARVLRDGWVAAAPGRS